MDGVPLDVERFKAQYERVYTMHYDGIADAAKLPADAPSVLTLGYAFVDGTSATVEYLDYDINNYALRKDGELTVLVRKDACAQMLEGWEGLK